MSQYLKYLNRYFSQKYVYMSNKACEKVLKLLEKCKSKPQDRVSYKPYAI